MSRIAEGQFGDDLFGGWSNPATPTYPNAPGFRGERDGPSALAARSAAKTSNQRRLAALECLKASAVPLTADEVARRLGISVLACRPRIAELRADGVIVPDEKRGRSSTGMTCHRWRVVAVSS